MTNNVEPNPADISSVDDGIVLDIVRQFGNHSSAPLTLNRGVRHFVDPAGQGLVAFKESGKNQLVQLCDALCEESTRERLIGSFLEWTASNDRKVTAVQLSHQDAAIYAKHGFTVNQLGCTFSLDLDAFTLSGTRFMKTRNKISRAKRLSISVEEVSDNGDDSELSDIDGEWLREKGRFVSELAFLVGERGGRYAPVRRVFVARQEGRAMAYVTYSPIFGTEQPGWLYDLTRRRSGTPPGTIELIFVTAIERLREEGCRWLHLGMTPFVGIDRTHEIEGANSGVIDLILRQLYKRGAMVYPARTQEAFKLKWAPTDIKPEYIAFQDGPSIGSLVALLRLTRSIPW